jgi:hypothetical protein
MNFDMIACYNTVISKTIKETHIPQSYRMNNTVAYYLDIPITSTQSLLISIIAILTTLLLLRYVFSGYV